MPLTSTAIKGHSSSPAFAADAMLGSLARKLRMLGFDTAYKADITVQELIYRCRSESRILLTRNRQIKPMGHLVVWQVNGDGFWQEFMSISSCLASLEMLPAFLGRCTVCNGELEKFSSDEVHDRVPPGVLVTQEQFLVCSGCNRVYWQGTHEAGMKEEADRMMEMIRK